jgi:hypothetical protein
MFKGEPTRAEPAKMLLLLSSSHEVRYIEKESSILLTALGEGTWHYQEDGDDCGIFGAGRRPPPRCYSMQKQGNSSLFPAIPLLRKASGCFAVH